MTPSNVQDDFVPDQAQDDFASDDFQPDIKEVEKAIEKTPEGGKSWAGQLMEKLSEGSKERQHHTQIIGRGAAKAVGIVGELYNEATDTFAGFNAWALDQVGVPVPETLRNPPKIPSPDEMASLYDHFTSEGGVPQNAAERYLERGVTLGIMGIPFGPEALLLSVPASIAGQTTEELGGGKAAQTIAEIAGGVGPAVTPKLFNAAVKNVKNLVNVFTGREVTKEAASMIRQSLPRSKFNTQKEFNQYLKQVPNGRRVSVVPERGQRQIPLPGIQTESPPLTGRGRQSLTEEVGRILSPQKAEIESHAGQIAGQNIQARDNEMWELVGRGYDRSAAANAEVISEAAQTEELVDRLTALRDRLSPADPTDASIIGEINQYINGVVERGSPTEGNPLGEITGYRDINNQSVIEQIQGNNRHRRRFGFEQAGQENKWKLFNEVLENHVISTAEEAGADIAIESFNQARDLYRNWHEVFNSNALVKQFRNRSDTQYLSKWTKAQQPDNMNIVRGILNITPEGQVIGNQIARDAVEKQMSKYLKEPSKAIGPDYQEDLRRLRSVLSPEEVTRIDRTIQRRRQVEQRRPQITARPDYPKMPESVKNIAEKYKIDKPEDFKKIFSNNSTIEKFSKDIQRGSPEAKAYWERLKAFETRSMLYEGNIDPGNMTGADFAKIMNKESNYSKYAAMYGEEAADQAFEAAKKMGSRKITKHTIKKFVSNTAGARLMLSLIGL